MSWFSPHMGANGSRRGEAPSSSASAGAVPPRVVPQTPESVKDLGPEVCYDVGAFRELMRQYRQLDDGVTTRLNRALARSRSSGVSSSPSLLSPASSSSGSGHSDLGTSTYAQLPQSTCLDFWRELTANWRGRQDVIRFCVQTVDAEADRIAAEKAVMAERTRREMEPDNALNADWKPTQGSPALASNTRLEPGNAWDSRGSRAESREEAMRRQLHNEEAIDRIVRNRSLQFFKTRCTLFRLPPDASPAEKALYEGGES